MELYYNNHATYVIDSEECSICNKLSNDELITIEYKNNVYASICYLCFMKNSISNFQYFATDCRSFYYGIINTELNPMSYYLSESYPVIHKEEAENKVNRFEIYIMQERKDLITIENDNNIIEMKEIKYTVPYLRKIVCTSCNCVKMTCENNRYYKVYTKNPFFQLVNYLEGISILAYFCFDCGNNIFKELFSGMKPYIYGKKLNSSILEKIYDPVLKNFTTEKPSKEIISLEEINYFDRNWQYLFEELKIEKNHKNISLEKQKILNYYRFHPLLEKLGASFVKYYDNVYYLITNNIGIDILSDILSKIPTYESENIN
jgi:hypothetical protein